MWNCGPVVESVDRFTRFIMWTLWCNVFVTMLSISTLQTPCKIQFLFVLWNWTTLHTKVFREGSVTKKERTVYSRQWNSGNKWSISTVNSHKMSSYHGKCSTWLISSKRLSTYHEKFHRQNVPTVRMRSLPVGKTKPLNSFFSRREVGCYEENDWRCSYAHVNQSFFLWSWESVFPFMVFPYTVSKNEQRLVQLICHYSFSIATVKMLWSSDFYQKIVWSIYYWKTFPNLKEKVPCENSGTQATRLILARHMKLFCSDTVLYQLPQFSNAFELYRQEAQGSEKCCSIRV